MPTNNLKESLSKLEQAQVALNVAEAHFEQAIIQTSKLGKKLTKALVWRFIHHETYEEIGKRLGVNSQEYIRELIQDFSKEHGIESAYNQ